MATLYEIEQEILSCVDEDTGEVIDFEKLEELALERDKKIESIALWVKNLEADSKAYKEEEDSFKKKRKAAENRANSLKAYLTSYLAGTAYKSNKVNISFRSSKAAEVYDLDALMRYDDCDSFLKYKDPEPNKTAIKKAIDEGIELPGCRIVENSNIQIK
jgi:hypothetical protein